MTVPIPNQGGNDELERRVRERTAEYIRQSEDARRQAEQTVRNEVLFSNTMIESMPGVLYFYDVKGHFLRWNRNFEVVTGYSAAEIARMHPLDFFRNEDKPLLEQRIKEVFEKGESLVE